MSMPFIRDNKTTLKIPISASQEAVWELLTTPQGLGRWLPVGCEGEIHAGAQFQMTWSDAPSPEDVSTHRVTVFEPGRRRFGFTWPAVQLVFELTRQMGMTVVKLTCTYNSQEPYSDLQIEELAGWTMHMLTLKSVAEGGVDLRTPVKTFSWEKGFITGI